MTHPCNCCQQCQAELVNLRQRNQSLVADYTNLLRKQQLTQQLESAYQSHQRMSTTTIHSHSQTIQKHQATIQQQNNIIQQQQQTISQQKDRIDQMEQQLNLFQHNNADHKGQPQDSMQDELYRKDLSLSQQLHRVIDAKNRDLLEMQQRIRSMQPIQRQNQQLRNTIARLNETLAQIQNHNNQLQAERLAYTQTIEVINRQPQISVLPKIQPTSSYVLQDRPVAARSTPLREQSTGEKKLMSSVLDSLKIAPSLSSTTVTSPSNQNRLDEGHSLFRKGSNECRHHNSHLEQLQRHRQLELIRSRISQLQEQNNILRGQLTSKI